MISIILLPGGSINEDRYENRNDDSDSQINLSNNPPNKNQFNYYKEISIYHSKVSGLQSLDDFPFLISIYDSDLHEYTQSSGNDIAFSNGIAWLDHEIELFERDYNTTHAKLVVWVRLPSLSTTVDTIIYLYYGNATMNPRENPTGVWDTNYKGVWHSSEDPTGTIYDSTSNENDGTPQGSMGSADQIDGQIGGSLNYEGDDEYIDCGNPPELQITGSITVEAWFKADYFENTYLISKNGESHQRGWDISFDDINSTHGYLIYRYALNGEGHADDVGNVTVAINQWYHVVGVFDASTYARLFLNGQMVDENTTNIISSQYDAPNTIRFGARGDDPPPNYYNGKIDEIRISNIARSADWIKTGYENQFNPNSFYSIGKKYDVSDHPPNIHYFTWYKEIVINHTRVSGPDDLFNFPVLISCLDEDLHDKVQVDGDDIAFSYGMSWLDHEIELFDQTYNSTHAELVAWVRVPHLSTSVDTVIRMYYGNSTMTNRENKHGVWSDYKGVWHFSESSGDAKDSTLYDVNGTTTDIGYQENGIGYCFNWTDGESSQVNYGNPVDNHLDFGTGNLTISLWVNLDQDVDNFQWIVSKGRRFANDPGFIIISDITPTSRWRFNIGDDSDVYQVASDTTIDCDEWHYIVGKIDRFSDLMYIYQDDGTADSSLDISSLGSIDSDIDLVQPFNPSSYGFDGLMDEFRLTDICRSEGWINTEYNNQYNPTSFYSIGKEYTISGNPPNQNYFTYYKELTIDHSMVSGVNDLINFPLLISTYDEDLDDNAQEDGDDIAFSNNGAWLDHEIELFNQSYNSSHAQLIAWVRIPRLSASSDTIIRIYYGNSSMVNRENKVGVWNSDYKGVYHLSEDPTGTTYDSTSNDKDGTPNGMESGDQKTGKIDGSLHFDGTTSEYDDIPYTNLGSSLTYSFWFKFLGGTGDSDSVLRFMGGLISFSDTWNYIRWYPDVYSSKTEISYNFPDSNWHYFAVFQSGTTCSIYIDDVAKANDVSCSSIRNNHIYSDFGNGFDGYLDEVRISNVARSADWIRTEYENQNDPTSFLTIGPEERDDNTPPTFSTPIESSDPLELGNIEIIKINASDPSGINQVKIEFMGTNHSMSNIGGDTWQYDTWTPSIVDNYTYSIWIEDNYSNWNSTIGTIEVIDTTSPTFSDLIESADPLQLGQNETIAIKVYESPGSGVNQTLLEYDSLNHTMVFIGGNTWSWNKWKPLSLGLHSYNIYMQDIENNWNMTSGTIMVVSTTAPVIQNLTESENPLELGNNITIMVDVFDNESYVDIVFIELDGVNHTMMNTTSRKTYEFNWTRSYVGIVYYTIYANDSNNNWNSYSSSFDIVDTTPPSFSGITKSEDPLEFGDAVTISVNSTDLADINQVKIEFMGFNHSMTNISGYKWRYDSWIPTSVGNITYTIWAEDNNQNWGFISDSVLVQDTTPPVYSDLVESSNTVELGDLLVISINSTDLANIKDVSIEFENSNHTMTNIGSDIWQYNSWAPNSIGNYSYKIYITDNNDNLAYVSSSIIFQDTIIPVYSNLFESADPLELGDNQVIRIDIYDFAGINQSLLEFEGVNHSMTNIYGETWQLDSWTPNNWIVYQYRIHMEDNSGNWNNLTGNITVQDTTPPPSPVLTYSPSGDVSGRLVFDWSDGSDPSGISYYILIIDNETDPYATPGYIHIFNITNVGSNSSYLELPEILSVGRYYFFLAQIDGVGQQGSFTMGNFTVISTPGNNNLMIIVIIALLSVIGSLAAIVIVKKKLKKDIAPPRKKISLKIISSHINKLSSSEFALPAEEFQAITSEGVPSKPLTDERELENRINEIRTMGEELFADGAYLEAQEQFKLGRELLLNLGREEEANLFSELIFGIEGLIEEREKRLEVLEETRVEGDSEQIFDLYQDIIDISKQLRDPDGVSYYQSELIQYFQINKLGVVDLETYRFNLNQKAESSFNNNVFKIAAQLYEKCEKISQLLVQLGRDEEISKIEDFRYKRNECLKRIS